MFYGDNVQDTRQMFFSSWEKYQQKQALLPLEKQIVDVILAHPEYHTILQSLHAAKDKIYLPELGETNPFLHMGLHLAIKDQVATDRPLGIADVYQQLLIKHMDFLLVEHLMMDYLMECLWQAQRNHRPPDEAHYLKMCQQLLLT